MLELRIKCAAINCALCLLFLVAAKDALRAQVANNLAPGAPGADAQWTGAGKQGIGTANTLQSKVWFTLGNGMLTEVYYPNVTIANTRALQLIVVSGDGRNIEVEETNTTHRVEVLDSRALSFRQINTAKSGAYTITKTYTIDPAQQTILIDVRFEEHRAVNKNKSSPSIYVYYDPSLNNSGMHDSAWTQEGALLASDADKASALVCNEGFDEQTNGYFKTSDGLTQLQSDGRIANHYARAADGNVVQVARVKKGNAFTLALGFGKDAEEAFANARASLAKGFARARFEYEAGWHEYVGTLRLVEAKYQAQFEMAAMVLRAHEDKTYRGAMIASLTVPWGGGANANEPNVGGYHLVWSRDLYEVATALYALGDKAGADRALGFLFTVQQKPDGSFPQNSWLDGRPFWTSLQMDEVAFPLILALRLGRTDNQTWTRHVKPAADFLLRNGPRTPQERWEEKAGYSPSTIAAEISGLVCAAEIARRNNDEAAANLYLAAADDWTRNLERWTATSSGVYGDKNYYLRLTENDDPNDGARFDVGNGGGIYDEREIVDAGFLELVRLGIKRADDPLITKSLAVIDQVIKVETPNGADWYRYNHDGYGEKADGSAWDGKGVGRLWALLAGERGEYELARGDKAAARARLDAMMKFANEGRMIPEQVWDRAEPTKFDFRFGEGAGSATPLAWSMAQFIRLAVNLEEGRNTETQGVVAKRYIENQAPLEARLADDDVPLEEAFERRDVGELFRLTARLEKSSRVFVMVNDAARELTLNNDGRFDFNLRVPEGETFLALGVASPTGATSFQRTVLRGVTTEEKRAEELKLKSQVELVGKLKRAASAPVIEGDNVMFIYSGEAKRVEVVGDFTNWRSRALLLQDVPGTNLKVYTRAFGRDARVEYKLLVDGEMIVDPLNPQRVDNGVGGFNSFITMPAYHAASLAEESGATRGALETVEMSSRLLGANRKLQIYLPAGYAQSSARYPALYLQDGSDYVKRARAAIIADNLIAQKRVEPFIIVFIDPVERMRDYWANDRFSDFVATEMLPFIDAHYRTRADRNSRALLGASLGGVISVWTALRHPDLFARIAGQSSAFQIDDERVVGALRQLKRANTAQAFKFYFDVGKLEPIVDVNRRVRVMLASKGYRVAYLETETGHNWTSWRDRLESALQAIWNDQP